MYTRAFLKSKSPMLTSRLVVDRSVCIGKNCGDNRYHIQGTQGRTIATRCAKTASQKTATTTDANCWYKHWWCRALRYSWCFQVSMASVESFLLNLGSTYVITVINTCKARNEAHYKMLLERIANLFLHLVYRIFILEPQRNESNTARVGSCPAALPFSLVEAGAFMFSSTIIEQRDCLAVSFMEEEIDSIEMQFKVFLRKYHNDNVF
jgi:hypothetical protein